MQHIKLEGCSDRSDLVVSHSNTCTVLINFSLVTYWIF